MKHSPVLKNYEVRQNVLSPVSMRSRWTLARLPPLFIRQNSLGPRLEIDLLCVVYRAKWNRKSRKMRLCGSAGASLGLKVLESLQITPSQFLSGTADRECSSRLFWIS